MNNPLTKTNNNMNFQDCWPQDGAYMLPFFSFIRKKKKSYVPNDTLLWVFILNSVITWFTNKWAIFPRKLFEFSQEDYKGWWWSEKTDSKPKGHQLPSHYDRLFTESKYFPMTVLDGKQRGFSAVLTCKLQRMLRTIKHYHKSHRAAFGLQERKEVLQAGGPVSCHWSPSSS